MLWLKWSWRDLRSRWVQVAAIAIVIAFGTGIFSGLRSTNVWRGLSNDASYAAANTFDLRVELGTGSLVDRGALLDVLAEIDSASVAAAEERLVLPSQVSVQTADGTVFVPGRLVGVDLSEGGPHVNTLHAALGRNLDTSDVDRDVVVLEHNFAKVYDLPASGSAWLSGDVPVEYVGQTLAPEYFFVVTPEGGLLAQANFAAVFTSIETAQRLTGADGKINDLLIRLDPGVDDSALYTALGARLDEVGATVTRRLDDPSIRLMIEDVEGDRQFNTVLAIAILGGAVFAAFNLTSRVMDSQRREIGIALALGLPPLRVALRPLLFSAQVALLGVVFGIGMGVGMAEGLGAYLEGFLPLPEWRTPFQFDVFAVAAVLGFAIPFLATAIPVWRAVRVPPVTAIRTGHLAARSGGLAWLITKFRIPGQTVRQIPFRNIARAPRRTLLTALAISSIVAILVLLMGMLDSFLGTLERSAIETAGDSPDRVEITLDTFYPSGSPTVRNLADLPATTAVEPGLRLGGEVSTVDDSFEVFVNFIDFDSDMWRPTVTEGSLDASTLGVLISEKAASDLGVGPGDMVSLRHPVLTGPTSFAFRETSLPVLGLHPHPFRINVYLHVDHVSMIGVDGLTNVVGARPADGVEMDTLKRDLFNLPGVVSVQKATAASDVFKDQFEQYTGLLQFLQLFIMILALLIAYNTASINMDERQREHATMFAYGLPVRTVLGMAVTESAILGVLSTILGLIGGYLLLQWLVIALMPAVMPDLGMTVLFRPVTLVTAVVLGIAAVAVAPLLTVRRLLRMDVPSTLRVME